MRGKVFIAVALVVLLVCAGIAVWHKLYREVPQPGWITADRRDNFIYGSIGTEKAVGIPYWVWLALPRMFPEYLPGPGGYAALGFPWEEGREMPVGFSKKTVGYVRVAGNCALCHAASYRKDLQDVPAVAPARSAHAVNSTRLLLFFARCAKDPRFNATDILAEIDMATKLSIVDRLLYRFVLIPRTRKAILEGRPVFIDEELREHSRHYQPGTLFSRNEEKEQDSWLTHVKAPAYPLAIDGALAAAGKAIFAQQCGSCHTGGGEGKRLDGIWLRGPYLHNCSVPTIRDLLSPMEQRPGSFYRGNDLLDSQNVGFISTEASDMGRQFLPYSVGKEGNSNSGHLYGIALSVPDKNALLEYLKTL
jgi:mono/diheme cytochrome c family protein